MSALLICQHDQGSQEWLNARLGVITASEVHALLPDARSKTFKYKESRRTYMNKLIGEVCTGYGDEINARALQWGKDNEENAIAAYEFETGLETEKIGLIYKDGSKRTGASADFKIKGKDHGGEVKCPITPLVYINFLLDEEIKAEYTSQLQFGLWVTDWEAWDFANYHPRMKAKRIHRITVERDRALMEYFENEIPKFCSEMDEKLKQIGIEYGAQWL